MRKRLFVGARAEDLVHVPHQQRTVKTTTINKLNIAFILPAYKENAE